MCSRLRVASCIFSCLLLFVVVFVMFGECVMFLSVWFEVSCLLAAVCSLRVVCCLFYVIC